MFGGHPLYPGFGIDDVFQGGKFFKFEALGDLLIGPATAFSGKFTLPEAPNRLVHFVGATQANYPLETGSIVVRIIGPSPPELPVPALLDGGLLILVALLALGCVFVPARLAAR